MEMLDKVKETEERAKTEKSEAKAKAARMLADARDEAEREADRRINDAKKNAADIVAAAREQAKAQTAQSEKRCAEEKEKLQAAVGATKQKTAELLVSLL